MNFSFNALAGALLLALLGAPAGANDTLMPARSLGGELHDPVIVDDRVYVPSGRIISTWDYSDQDQPAQLASTAETPASGHIRGLTRRGDYLYASWQAGDDSGGVAVYSLANPDRPELVNEFSDYTPAAFKNLWTLAAVGDTLFLFDAENGIYYGDLSTAPEHPKNFTRLLRSPTPYSRAQVVGDHVFISGTTFSSEPHHVCGAIDVTTPASPVFLAGACGDGPQPEHFRTRIQSPYAAKFGLRLDLYDVANPTAAPQPLGGIDIDPATDGFIAGDYAYSLGFGEIAIHDISDPSAPETVAYAPGRTLGTDSVSAFHGGALVLTSTDRFLHLDVSDDPLSPMERSVVEPLGGTVPRDIALHNDRALILQENYGFSVADPQTLNPNGRFDAALPSALNQRAIEQFAVAGNRAYLAAWGYGLIVVELGFANPFELGRLEFPEAAAIAAQGDFVYLGKSGSNSVIQVVDVSVPEKPLLRGSLPVASVQRLQVHGDHLYVADPLTGIRVIDISNPDAPSQIRIWNAGCANAGGFTAEDIELRADGQLAAVGCPTGLHLLDLSTPGDPVRVGGHGAKWANPRVAIAGNRAWYADRFGLKLFDISTASNPALLADASLAGFIPRRLRSLGDGRVFAFGNQTGLQVFGSRDPSTDDTIFADGFEENVSNQAKHRSQP